ncbi:hypothetical protein GF385_03470 [Candidatus Dependentiae bacterium]|nr:hypothetical protein [Candidatus Dependentiae bacterium]
MLTEGFNFLYIAFQLTLFLLLVIALYKISQQYLIPSLYSQIELIKKKRKDLRDKENLLLESKKNLKEQIKEQENSFKSLEVKIQSWHQNLLEEKNNTIKNNKELEEKIKNKRAVQSKNLSLFKMQKIVIPQSIKKAYKEIENLYGGKKSLHLLKELIKKIEPNN